MDLWPKIHDRCPDIKFQLVPFENTPENAREILRNLGQHIDVVAGIFDETMLELRQCAGFPLSREPLGCAVSIHHPLAQKNRLSIARPVRAAADDDAPGLEPLCGPAAGRHLGALPTNPNC